MNLTRSDVEKFFKAVLKHHFWSDDPDDIEEADEEESVKTEKLAEKIIPKLVELLVPIDEER